MTEETNDTGVTRRQALTRLGVGAAVVWTVPIVTGVTMPAMAEGSVVTSRCTDCSPTDACTGQPPCGDPTGNCFCSSQENHCGCYNGNVFCSDVTTCPDGTCPDGYSCFPLTCCGEPVCLLPCGVNYPASKSGANDGRRPGTH
jgi:hypothetical protein